MKKQSLGSWAFYTFGVVAITMFIADHTLPNLDFWWRVALSLPFWAWLLTLSTAVFGKAKS